MFVAYTAFSSSQKSATQVLSETSQKVAAKTLVLKEIIPTPKQPQYGLPLRLQIPKIKVDASILDLGLTNKGKMDAPPNLSDVGWYELGTRPGDIGSAVIDGHLGVGEPGVFIDLHKLQKGDDFTVLDDKGQTITFVVRETKTYKPDDHPSEVFTSSEGRHLNLITCTGDWDKRIHGMSNRLVIFADLVN